MPTTATEIHSTLHIKDLEGTRERPVANPKQTQVRLDLVLSILPCVSLRVLAMAQIKQLYWPRFSLLDKPINKLLNMELNSCCNFRKDVSSRFQLATFGCSFNQYVNFLEEKLS